jgi:mono/diheme cytochrome c family protein
MVNKTMAAVTLLIILNSCSRKTAPQIPERTVNTRSINVEADLKGDPVKGKQIFSAGCKRCHGLPEAGQFTRSRWESVLPAMIRNAGLDAQEAADIREYINNNLIKN